MVDPTKLKPRDLMSLLIASDTAELAGICDDTFHLFTIGL
jgi:hypothetical protein